jgi:hypothetical protein
MILADSIRALSASHVSLFNVRCLIAIGDIIIYRCSAIAEQHNFFSTICIFYILFYFITEKLTGIL